MLPVPAIWWLINAFFNSSDDAVDGIYSSIKSA
jgi:hypothetical protein